MWKFFTLSYWRELARKRRQEREKRERENAAFCERMYGSCTLYHSHCHDHKPSWVRFSSSKSPAKRGACFFRITYGI